MALSSFLFGGQTGETPQSIRQKRDLARAILGASNAPKNVGEGLNALGDGLVAGVLNKRADAAEAQGTKTADALFNSIIGGGSTGSSPSASTPVAAATPFDGSSNDVYKGFIDTVKTGVTNPYGLAAVAATGRAESGYDPKRAVSTWSDPSQSGQPGTSGGIMSWRGPRYAALASTGDLSPAGQGKFFLQENPQLIAALNNAKSVDEAQQLMNNAWKFAGYNQPSKESARRLSYANSFLPNFQGQQQPTQVASLDPSIGMPKPAAAQEMQASSPTPGNIPVPTARPQQPLNEIPTLESGNNVAPPVFLNAPHQVAQATPQRAQINPLYLQALNNPWLSEGQRASVKMLIEQDLQAQQQAQEESTWRAREDYKLAQQKADPAWQLEQDVKRAQLEALKQKTGKTNLINAGEGNIYDPDTGEWIKAPSANGGGAGGFRFGGNSVEAQALNGLIASGELTADQAQQLAAGKTITDPSTGAMVFLTPQGIFRQPGTPQQAQPQQQSVDLFGESAPQQQPQGVDLFGSEAPATAPAPAPDPATAPSAPAQTSAPMPAAPAPAAAPSNTGIIPLTGGKPQKLLTETERRNQALFSVVKPELKTVEDNFDALSDLGNQAGSKLPLSDFVTTPEYQKATNSLQTIVASYLYAMSGATAPPEEVRRQADILTPRAGEAKESVAAKKLRVRTMVNAIAQAGSLPSLEEPAVAPPQAENPLPPTPQPQGQRPRAVNPQTGQTIEFDGTQWVPVL